MIHLHGTPIGGKREDVARFLEGRHALISFFRSEDIGTASEVCQSFCVDNGAFSAWRQNKIIDWDAYYAFCEQWYRHPCFEWAIIPDVIDGTEEENDALLDDWPGHIEGVPVWHMNESLDRLDRLCGWPRLALGSSGDFATVGSDQWWKRIAEAMEVICIGGLPRTKLHGLRMLDPKVFSHLPLASADSTNAARNGQRTARRCGCNTLTGMTIIAGRIEKHQSASMWLARPIEETYSLF